MSMRARARCAPAQHNLDVSAVLAAMCLPILPTTPTAALQIVQLTTFGINYVGHPFNSGLSENQGMRRSLLFSSTFLVVLVSQGMMPLNER